MLSINTNLSSIITQNSMKQSTNKLNEAIERMTTGYKINHAKDNAANYSISTNMSTKISAYDVAADNVAMGMDMLTTATDSLSLIEDKLSKLRSLAIQISNGTYGTVSKNAINAEACVLVNEIERIYSSIEYNGIKLLESESKTIPAQFQTKSTGLLLDIEQKVDTSTLTSLASVNSNTDLVDGEYSISTPEELQKLSEMTNAGLISSGDKFVLANDIDLANIENWAPIGKSYYDNPFQGIFNGNGYKISNVNIGRMNNVNDGVGIFGCVVGADISNLVIENAYIKTPFSTYAGVLSGLVYDSNIKNLSIVDSYIEGVRVGLLSSNLYDSNLSDVYLSGSISGSSCGGCTYFSSNSRILDSFINVDIIGTGSAGGLFGTLNANKTTVENTAVLGSINSKLKGVFCSTISNANATLELNNCYYGSNWEELPKYNILQNNAFTFNETNSSTIAITKRTDFEFQVGINNQDSSRLNTSFCIDLDNIFLLKNIANKDVEFSISTIDSYLSMISDKQTQLGAVQNRLESAMAEILTQHDNLVSARSTLRDADMAEVSSQYIQQQILQEASATLMATANQSPAIALQLI